VKSVSDFLELAKSNYSLCTTFFVTQINFNAHQVNDTIFNQNTPQLFFQQIFVLFRRFLKTAKFAQSSLFRQHQTENQDFEKLNEELKLVQNKMLEIALI
jgi:hypothetical protein